MSARPAEFSMHPLTATLPSLLAMTVALVINSDVIIEAKQFLAIRFYFCHVG